MVRKYFEFFSTEEKGTAATSDRELEPNNLTSSGFPTSYRLPIKIPFFPGKCVSAKCKLLHSEVTG